MSLISINEMIYVLCSLASTLLCIILKVPQIVCIIQSHSTLGINKKSLFLELWAYLSILSYSYSLGYPFSIYSEYPFLVFADIILVLIILHYENSITLYWLSVISAVCLFHLSVALDFHFKWLPILLVQTATPIAWYSKASQCWTIISNRSAGQVSVMSWTMSAIASIARLITYIITIWDKIIMTTLFVSMILNASVAISAHVYRHRIKSE